MNSIVKSTKDIAEDRATDKIWRHYDPDLLDDSELGPWPSMTPVRLCSDVYMKYRDTFNVIDTAVQLPKHIHNEMQRYRRAKTYMKSEHDKNINALWIF